MPAAAPAPPAGRPRRLRRVALILLAALLLGLAALAGPALWVRLSARGHLYTAADVPAAPVALVLGAQVYAEGQPSPFLAARLALAKHLYDTGKVRAILVSGDNRRHEYDEPTAMRRWLLAQGVPERAVVADFAGFDTYDSCHRAYRIFGVRAVTVVTQTFHLARAVTLCRSAGLAAAGVGDDTVRVHGPAWRRGTVREYGANVKAALDTVRRRDPGLLGPPEIGITDALR